MATRSKQASAFEIIASTDRHRAGAAEGPRDQEIYGIQFHLRWSHRGKTILRNFVVHIHVPRIDPGSLIETSRSCGKPLVTTGWPRGVDSSVAAMLIHRHKIPTAFSWITAMRQDESSRCWPPASIRPEREGRTPGSSFL